VAPVYYSLVGEGHYAGAARGGRSVDRARWRRPERRPKILRLVAGAGVTVVATGIRKLEGLARVNGHLIAVTQGLVSGPGSNGTLLRFAVHADGTLGAPATPTPLDWRRSRTATATR
jgi:hypothetical protein